MDNEQDALDARRYRIWRRFNRGYFVDDPRCGLRFVARDYHTDEQSRVDSVLAALIAEKAAK